MKTRKLIITGWEPAITSRNAENGTIEHIEGKQVTLFDKDVPYDIEYKIYIGKYKNKHQLKIHLDDVTLNGKILTDRPLTVIVSGFSYKYKNLEGVFLTKGKYTHKLGSGLNETPLWLLTFEGYKN